MCKFIGLACSLIVFFTSVRGGDVGKDVEHGLGEMVAADLEATYGVVDDPLLTDWVDRLGQRLASVSGRTDIKYRFRILDSYDINAVSAPGGFVYVNRGTLRFVESEDELATVLGHEVGHIAGRHAMKQLTAQVLGTLALLGFQATGANTLRTVGGLAGGLAMLKFSRDEENDADRRGLRNAVATGYDGGAMITFFRHLDKVEKEKVSKLEGYFLTHPPTEERIRRISEEPGTADTAANALGIGDGRAERSLYQEAAEAYRHALNKEPDSLTLKQRLADAQSHEPRLLQMHPLASNMRAERIKQLDSIGKELEDTRQGIESDQKKLSDRQQEMDHVLEDAARSLTDVSHMVGSSESLQNRQFLRLAHSFDQATRVEGDLRAVRELTEETLKELADLIGKLKTSIDQNDGFAADQVAAIQVSCEEINKDTIEGMRQANERAGNSLDGARALRQAAGDLDSSFRSRFGFTSGQFDLLDLQVSTAQDTMHDSEAGCRRAIAMSARARLELLVSRIDYLTRSVAPDDSATSGIIAHYLGVEQNTVTAARTHIPFGDAALALANDRMQALTPRKREAERGSRATAKEVGKPTAIGLRLHPENAIILFNLIAHDLDHEISMPKTAS